MTFTMHSYSNGDILQFNLTCISTGGPATTVIWTRGSEIVSEGNKTELNDSETAQYIHTLTVVGRLEGLYQCNVSNKKTSEDTKLLLVKGILIYMYSK